MELVFYLSSGIAIASTLLVITQLNAVHALLYAIVSLLAVAIILFTLGAAFVAALEIIIYAGAIMVLFVFVVMMLNLGAEATEQERRWLQPGTWIGPAAFSIVLIAELVFVLGTGSGQTVGAREIPPKEVGIALFGPYLVGVELASMVLLAGLVGAYHLGRRELETQPRAEPISQPAERPAPVMGEEIPLTREPAPETEQARVR